MEEFILRILTQSAIYGIIAISLNLMVGYTRLISLSHAAFCGIGAYCVAILTLEPYNFSFILVILFSILLTGFLAYFIGYFALRTIDDYFIICTIAIQFILFSLFKNLRSITNGAEGISNISHIEMLGYHINDKISLFILSFILMIVTYYLISNLSKSSFGKILIAISEDEVYTHSLGKDVPRTKLIVFVLSSIFASVAGVLFAYQQKAVTPNLFTLDFSILLLTIVIVGGLKDYIGTILATIFMVFLPIALEYLPLFFGNIMITYPKVKNIGEWLIDHNSEFTQIIFGIILVYSIFYYRVFDPKT